MSNAHNLTPGHIDRLTGTFFSDVPHLDKFRTVARDIRAIDQAEAIAEAQEAYADLWELSVRLAARVATLRSLGHKDSRESRVLDILDGAVKALENEGLGL
jgi:anaerobic glycerol-3-phosphate dehydrogenase